MAESIKSRLSAWPLLLMSAIALGVAWFGWAVTGALHEGLLVRTAAALAAALFMGALLMIESQWLSRRLEVPVMDTAARIVVSWAPLALLPLSAPYFTHQVASSFLRGDPSAGRVLLLATAMILLAAAGSVALKVLLFGDRAAGPFAWLERNAVRLLWAGVLVYFVVFVSLAFAAYFRYKGFHSDLGQYNQTLWASLRGRIFWSTLDETSPNTYLSTHVSPFLLLLLPVYALRQSPLTYLFLRSLGLSLAAVPLFYCVRRLTGSAAASLLLSAAFLFHPEIVSQHFSSGYEVVFVAAFFFAAFYFFTERRFGLFIFFLVMVLTVREDFMPVALVFAVYALIKRRGPRWILTPLALFVVWGTAVILIYNATIVHYVFNLYYGHFGGSPGEMVKTVITHPVYALEEVKRYHTSYLYNLLMPEGLLLPFASAASLFALPNLAATLSRGQDITAASGGISHYSVLVVSSLWLGLAGFISIVQKRVGARGRLGGAAAVTPVFVAVVIAVFVAGSAHLWLYELPVSKPADADALTRAIEMVPAEASLSSNDGRALAHLSSRWEVYEPLLWDVPEEPDRLPQGMDQLQVDYVLVKPFGNPYFNDAGAFSFLTEPGSPYRLQFEENGIRLFRRE